MKSHKPKRRTKKRTKKRTKRRTRKRVRQAIPDPQTIVSTSKLKTPSGRVYRIIETTQKDPYDPPGRLALH